MNTKTFIASFVPDSITNDQKHFRRARILVSLTLIYFAIAVVNTTTFFWVYGFSSRVFLTASFFCTEVLVLVALRSGALALASHVFVSSMLAVFVAITWLDGGISSPYSVMLVVPAMSSLLILGRGPAFFYMTVVSLYILTAGIAAQIGWLHPSGYRQEFDPIIAGESLLAVALGCLAMAFLFEGGRLRMQRLFEQETSVRQQKIDEAITQINVQQEELHRKDIEAIALEKQSQQYLADSVQGMLFAMEKFASGNLIVAMDVNSDDDIGRLYKGFNAALANVRGMVGEVADAVKLSESSSWRISTSTDELGKLLQLQADEAKHVSAAVEQIIVALSDTSTYSSNAAREAEGASVDAQKGGEVARSTVTVMESIASVVLQSAERIETLGHSSEQIGEIVRTIEEIADQTNLLALNAAIEAARAGDSGRGFAVVADEVRKLAERTQSATKQIATTIRNVQTETASAVSTMKRGAEQVQRGQTAAEQTASSIESIIARTRSVAELIGMLAQASETQVGLVKEVSTSAASMSNHAEHCATNTHGIALQSLELNLLMESLQQLLKEFVTRGEGETSEFHGKGIAQIFMNDGHFLTESVKNTTTSYRL